MAFIHWESLVNFDQFALVVVNLLVEAQGGFRGVHFLEVAGTPTETARYVQSVPQHQPTPLERLLALAQGYAEHAMRNIGHVPPALLAESPNGLIQFVPDSLKDVRAKDSFANTARLVCLGYEVTTAVILLEAWMKMAKPGETLDMTEAPSEAFDRREVVVLTGETVQHCRQMLLPIIRTDAGGLFGLGEHVGPKVYNFEGRFAQMLPPEQPNAEDRGLARAMLAAMRVTKEHLRGDAGRKLNCLVRGGG